jgi:hypothetical protein
MKYHMLYVKLEIPKDRQTDGSSAPTPSKLQLPSTVSTDLLPEEQQATAGLKKVVVLAP